MMSESSWTESELQDERVEDLVEQIMARSPAPAPLDWRTVTATEAPIKWKEVFGFVQWLVVRYQLPQNEIPQCWYLHGALTEELTALAGSHAVCFDPTQIASAASDWHRILFEARHRLREWAAMTNCQINDHRDGNPQRWASHPSQDDKDQFTAHVEEHLAIIAPPEALD